MIEVTIFADDLTGALDTGVKFTASGKEGLIVWKEPVISGDFLVIDTETRNACDEEATSVLSHWIPAAQGLVYKKIDSTLRGPFVAEAMYLQEALELRGILVAPSFPETGRQVMDGHLLVQGVPLEETAMAYDPHCPMRTGAITEVARQSGVIAVGLLPLTVVRQGKQPVKEWLAAREGFVVADALTNSDLDVLAEAISEFRDWLPVGSAGLASSLTRALGWQAGRSVGMVCPRPQLFVVGSAHQTSQEQLQNLMERREVLSIVVSEGRELSGMPAVLRAFQHGLPCVVQTPEERLTDSGTMARIGKNVARVAAKIIQESSVNCVFVTGGDTLYCLMRELGTRAMCPVAEVEPGVVLSRVDLPDGRELQVISKAGGFGDEGLLVRLADYVGNP